MKWCGENERNLKAILISDWFDLFNTVSKFGTHRGLHSYGINLQDQNIILSEMNDFMTTVKVGEANRKLPYQEGIIINSKSLTELYEAMRCKYKIEYIVTRKLNQDLVENFFFFFFRKLEAWVEQTIIPLL